MSHLTFKVKADRSKVTVTMPVSLIQLVELEERGEPTEFRLINTNDTVDALRPCHYELEPSEFFRVKQLLEHPRMSTDPLYSVCPPCEMHSKAPAAPDFNKISMPGCGPLGNPDAPVLINKPGGPITEIEEHDMVVFVDPEEKVAMVGTHGTVVHIHEKDEAYEVEYKGEGNQEQVATVTPDMVDFFMRPGNKPADTPVEPTGKVKEALDKAEVAYDVKNRKIHKTDKEMPYGVMQALIGETEMQALTEEGKYHKQGPNFYFFSEGKFWQHSPERSRKKCKGGKKS